MLQINNIKRNQTNGNFWSYTYCGNFQVDEEKSNSSED